MGKVIVQIGRDFGTNKWGINFGNQKSTIGFHFDDNYKQTCPFPGKEMDEEEIKHFIDFLQEALVDGEGHE